MIFTLDSTTSPHKASYLVMSYEYYRPNHDPFELLHMIKEAFPNQVAYVGCYVGYEDCVVLRYH